MLKYIFGLIFVALAWAAVFVFRGIGMLPAILTTVVVAVILGAVALYQVLRARKAAAQIESSLNNQASAHAGGARPDLQAEIAAMQAEFNKAVASLKVSKLGRSGRDALSVLPWYVIIGPPGAGKTTALRNSGLKFPYAAKGGRVRGVGGTRNCDWWMTNQAIILDTAGRWATEDDDHDEWLAFLDLMRKTRPRKPINGILVAVSIDDLQADEEEIAALGKTLRERVDEVMGRLDVVLPVYLLVTKCDLIPGFVETFGDMRDKDRGQIWGATLPLGIEAAETADVFAERLDRMTEVLERYSLRRLGEERRIEARAQIHQLPQQFESLRGNLIDLVANIFAENVYRDAPLMRGVYFSSGTQEGRAVDRIMSKMAGAFGLSPRVAQSAAPPLKPKSYFVRDLFTRVIFPDREVAMRSSRAIKRDRITRLVVTGVALLLAVGFVMLPVSSYRQNQAFIEQARTFVDRLAQAQEGAGVAALPSEGLRGAEAFTSDLANNRRDVLTRWGLYPGEELMLPMRKAVQRWIVRPILATDAAFLKKASARAGVLDEADAAAGLTLHLLLTGRKADKEPKPGDSDWTDVRVAMAASKAAERWAKYADDRAPPNGRTVVDNAVKFYALGIQDSASELLPRDAALVQGVREAMRGSGDPLAVIINSPSMPPDLKLLEIAGRGVTVFNPKSNPSVRGAFTPAGWKLVNKRLDALVRDSEAQEEAWIWNDVRKVTKEETLRWRADYVDRYINAWKGFLMTPALQTPATLEQARDLFNRLVLEKPLETVWANVKKNVVFKDDSLADQALAKALAKTGAAGAQAGKQLDQLTDDPLGPETVAKAFAQFLESAVLETYGSVLNELKTALGTDGTPDSKKFDPIFQVQKRKLDDMIGRYLGWESDVLRRILMPPLQAAQQVVSGASSASMNARWCQSVVAGFAPLKKRYPFPGSTAESAPARVPDVERFFSKTGILWAYYAEALAADIERPSGARFTVKPDVQTHYASALLTFLSEAQQITDALYVEPAKMNVQAKIRMYLPPGFPKMEFKTGEQSLFQGSGPERWQVFSWPARGATFRLLGSETREVDNSQHLDEWSLFRLLEMGKARPVQGPSEDFVEGNWPTALGPVVRAQFQPAGLRGLFGNLHVPGAIVDGPGGCGR